MAQRKNKNSLVIFFLLILAGLLIVASSPKVNTPGSQLWAAINQPLPDLAVSATRGPTTIVVTISNIGRSSAPSTTAAGFTSVGGVIGYFPQYQNVPSLAPGSSFIFSWTTPATTGRPTATVYADFVVNPNGPTFYTPLQGGAVTESDEGNNAVIV